LAQFYDEFAEAKAQDGQLGILQQLQEFNVRFNAKKIFYNMQRYAFDS
jgi:hypothetical protein